MAIVEDDDGISINLRHPERYESKTANKVYLGNVDLELFKAQRETLDRMIHFYCPDFPTLDHMQGLQALLDHIYDQLVPVEAEVEQ